MQYIYSVGQIVRARSPFEGRPRARMYQITRLLPPVADDLPQYRMRNVTDGVEWTVGQDRIEPASPFGSGALVMLG